MQFLRQPGREVVIKAWQREGRSWAEIDHSKGNGQMNKSRRSPHTFVFAITMLVAFPSPSPAQVRVLISGGFLAPYQELVSQFEKSTGITRQRDSRSVAATVENTGMKRPALR